MSGRSKTTLSSRQTFLRQFIENSSKNNAFSSESEQYDSDNDPEWNAGGSSVQSKFSTSILTTTLKKVVPKPTTSSIGPKPKKKIISVPEAMEKDDILEEQNAEPETDDVTLLREMESEEVMSTFG